MSRSQPCVLVVDDEQQMVDFLRVSLEERGFLVLETSEGKDAARLVRDEGPDLVLLDLGLPDMDGFQVLGRIREASSVAVVVVSAHDREDEIIHGLELGADDYVTKPFNTGELVARIEAVLRRTASEGARHSGFVAVDNWLQIDFDEHDVIVDGQRISLRPTEYRLLYHLVQNSGRTLTFQGILEHSWGPAYRTETHYVHLYVTYLRHKIEPDRTNPRYILTKRGVGYSFRRLPEGTESLLKVRGRAPDVG